MNLDFLNSKHVGIAQLEVAFPEKEFQERLKKVQDVMKREGIDTLYLTSPESMYYLTGYNACWYKAAAPEPWQEVMATGVAVNASCNQPMLFDIPDEEDVAYTTTVGAKIKIINDIPGSEMYGKEFQYEASENKGFLDLVVDILSGEGWTKGVVGLELGCYRPNPRVSQMLRTKLENQGSKIMDGTKVVQEVRTIKSPLEMYYIEVASRIADIGYKAAFDATEPGITELELHGIMTLAMQKAGGENAGLLNPIRSGVRSSSFHLPTSRKRVMYGDRINIDLCGVYNRYHSNLARYYCIGKPDKKFEYLYNTGVEAMHLIKEILTPNMLVKELMDKIKKFYVDKGVWEHKYWVGGYELGIAFPPDWVGSYVYDPDEEIGDDRFMPGMVVNFENGFGLIDTVVFTEIEAKILGETPWELQII
ncbi:MAG: Xaa-Pro peptidase family protein [Clostridia bacterium]|nr:Xaa-Pro peptidase family protein [Clostridia bacterium]